ncbi:MAG: glycosyltransferase family 4 protein [Devosia sp.]
MTLRPAAFAIPGDINRRTGGYIYERRLLEGLRAEGRRIDHIVLPASFPEPSQDEMAASIAAMAALPAECPLIVDGLVFGSADPAGYRTIGAPTIAMLHHPLGLETGLAPDWAAELLRREKANLEHARHVVVPSPHTARILVSEFAVPEEKISIALPGFDPRPAAPRRPADPPLILSVGLMARRKGHDVLVRALARITDLGWQAEIVGGPHEQAVEDELRHQIGALELAGRVHLRGFLSDAEVADCYGRASIFALATRYEGYGIVFGEAMVNGLPIVTCATGAVPETVAPEAGLLVPVDDDEAFATALRALLEDPGRAAAMARASAAAGEALPGWQDTAAVMSRVLDRV